MACRRVVSMARVVSRRVMVSGVKFDQIKFAVVRAHLSERIIYKKKEQQVYY
jgi:hypothetical protein